MVDQDRYRQDLKHSIDLLKGDNEKLSGELIKQMNDASEQLDYEHAARLRDQVNGIRLIQADQAIEKGKGNLDVVSAVLEGDEGCVHMLYVRQGRIIGSRSFFPKVQLEQNSAELLETFLSQHYLTGPEARVPAELLVSAHFDSIDVLEEALYQYCSRKITIRKPQRGRGLEWLQIAGKAAEQNLIGRKASKQSYERGLNNLSEALKLGSQLQRMECYDISHTQGNQTVGSCVVFDAQGPSKKDYRRFNIEGITGGDDYAAMEQVL